MTIQTLEPPGSDQGRFRFIVEEAVTGEILSRDLTVSSPKVLRALSGPCHIEFDVDYREYESEGLYFKPWGHWIHAEKQVLGQRRIWCSGLVQPSEIDKQSGVMHLIATGFAGYPDGMPILENVNKIAVDPFEMVGIIWDHLQSFENGNLGVVVNPRTSGILILPGYSFDGETSNFNFYAEYIRANQLKDAKEFIDSLARDIPFDYREQSVWLPDHSGITKTIELGYPIAGVEQDGLAFVLNENVLEAAPHTATQIDWASDIVISGWSYGAEVDSQFSNADPTRYRRVVKQDDVNINSNERAAAWSKRKLTKRQTPAYWESIIVDMGHPNAPFGYYDVGDRIYVTGYMPWEGDVHRLHKIIAISVDEEHEACQLTLMAEGAFSYDPIYYQGSEAGSIVMAISGTGIISIGNDLPAGANYVTTAVIQFKNDAVSIPLYLTKPNIAINQDAPTGGLTP